MTLPDRRAVILTSAALFGVIALSFVNRGSLVYLPPTPPESLYQSTPLGYGQFPLDLEGDDDDSSQTTEP